jgi:hypothetical protein
MHAQCWPRIPRGRVTPPIAGQSPSAAAMNGGGTEAPRWMSAL